MDYKYFFKQFMEIILNHAHTTKEMIENAQQFSFQVYDMNSDNYIDQTDLFSFMKDQSNENVLVQACYRDLNDIQYWIHNRQNQILRSDPVVEHNTDKKGAVRIKDIERYLGDIEQQSKNRDTFLEIFVN